MKSLLEVLVKQNIKTSKNFKVVKHKKQYNSDIENVYVVVDTIEDFNELISGKDFWNGRGEINSIKQRIELSIKVFHGDEYHLIGITTGHITGVLYDSSCKKTNIDNESKYYEDLGEISSEDFNIEYWKEKNWIIK